jgi:UDP-glucose 4-epimerase
MKIVVFGGGGFIGSQLATALFDMDNEVIAFDKPTAKYINILEKKGVHVYRGDLLNLEDLHKVLDSAEIVFHLVSTTVPKTSNENPIFDINSNLIGTLHLLDAAKNHKVRKIVFSSSGGTVYGNPKEIPISEEHPTNPICSYGIIKLTIEKYLQMFWTLYGVDYSILRISNAYGNGQKVNLNQGVIPTIISKTLAGEEIKVWGSGLAVRDYIYVDDVVSAFLDVLNYRGQERIFNIGSGIGYSVIEIISIIQKELGKSVLYCKDNNSDISVQKNILDITRAKRELNWIPRIDITEGIKRTIEFVKNDKFIFKAN